MDLLNLPEPINKIRLISATELISYDVKIPTCQRSQDEERIKEIIQYQENYFIKNIFYMFFKRLSYKETERIDITTLFIEN